LLVNDHVAVSSAYERKQLMRGTMWRVLMTEETLEMLPTAQILFWFDNKKRNSVQDDFPAGLVNTNAWY